MPLCRCSWLYHCKNCIAHCRAATGSANPLSGNSGRYFAVRNTPGEGVVIAHTRARVGRPDAEPMQHGQHHRGLQAGAIVTVQHRARRHRMQTLGERGAPGQMGGMLGAVAVVHLEADDPRETPAPRTNCPAATVAPRSDPCTPVRIEPLPDVHAPKGSDPIRATTSLTQGAARRAASAESPVPVAMPRTRIPGAMCAAHNRKGIKCAVALAKARCQSAATCSLKTSCSAIPSSSFLFFDLTYSIRSPGPAV